jgi:hypothetical protein
VPGRGDAEKAVDVDVCQPPAAGLDAYSIYLVHIYIYSLGLKYLATVYILLLRSIVDQCTQNIKLFRKKSEVY